jgi:hypothetical protein
LDFWTSVKVLARRWYIVAVGLLVTVGGAVGVSSLIAPSYTAAGSMVLAVPPNLPERAASANPYLAYGNLAVAAKVVASAMNQPSVVRDQRAKGATGTFVVDLDPERSSPIITVNSRAATAVDAIRTVEVVTVGVQQLLADRQKSLGAPQNTWITASSVVVPEEANRAVGSRLRAVSAVTVLGLIGTLSLAFALEGWSQGRRRASSPTAAERLAPAAPAPPPTPPMGICPICHGGFTSAEALSRHLEESHALSARPPAPAPVAPPHPAVPRQSPRRPLADAAAAASPPARRAARTVVRDPDAPAARARVAKKAATKSAPPAS